MKTFTFYKACSGYWVIEYDVKGQLKPRRQPVNGDLTEAVTRFKNKGYKLVNRYGYNR